MAEVIPFPKITDDRVVSTTNEKSTGRRVVAGTNQKSLGRGYPYFPIEKDNPPTRRGTG